MRAIGGTGRSRRRVHAQRRATTVGVATMASAARSGGDGKRHAGRAVRGRVTKGAGATCPHGRWACEALLNGLLGVRRAWTAERKGFMARRDACTGRRGKECGAQPCRCAMADGHAVRLARCLVAAFRKRGRCAIGVRSTCDQRATTCCQRDGGVRMDTGARRTRKATPQRGGGDALRRAEEGWLTGKAHRASEG